MKDIIKDIDGNGDLVIRNDDLVTGVSDMQHKQDLLLTEKGNIKQYPYAGVGAQTYLEAEDVPGLLREIGMQYSADGMKVDKIELTKSGILNVAAQYV